MEQRMTPTRWFQYPFRIFFLSVAIWGLIVIPLWVSVFFGEVSNASYLNPVVWHEHEMIFGLLLPAIAGFLLTAVCTWTRTERLHGWPLCGLWLVWLLGRITITFGGALPSWIPIVFNLAFTPLIFWDAARRIFLRRQRRQMPILIVLALLWVTEAIVLLLPASQMLYKLSTLQAALIATCAIMMLIGGRITPAFSKNWLKRKERVADAERIQNPNWLQHVVFALLVLLTVLVAARVQGPVVAIIATVTAIVTFVRIALWRGWLVLADPMLWILHLSLLWIPVGLLLLAGAQLGWWGNNVWAHAIGIGAMFSLIIGVMTRVALGHTGRKMQLPTGEIFAYGLIQLGAVLRVITALGWLPVRAGLIATAVCWVLAFLIFLVPYFPILSLPRADGKPG